MDVMYGTTEPPEKSLRLAEENALNALVLDDSSGSEGLWETPTKRLSFYVAFCEKRQHSFPGPKTAASYPEQRRSAKFSPKKWYKFSASTKTCS